jgi:hypothetical protein
MVQRIEETDAPAKRPRPIRLQLSPCPLNQFGIAQPCEAVIGPLEVGTALPCQLPGHPLAAAPADLNIEGEPGLDTGVAEGEAPCM